MDLKGLGKVRSGLDINELSGRTEENEGYCVC
jgi:hypothetical protein